MKCEKECNQKILIVDDSELNRAILADMLGHEYEIIEAENGVQAVDVLEQYKTEISIVLLDIVMPEMDGFGVLTVMNQRQWINDIPVIMISSEGRESHLEHAYELGITDFISRPFDVRIVRCRVVNTILLYAKQKKLASLAAEKIYEKEQQSNLMIDILSHIVEFRNGESGLHVLHIRILTGLLLRHLIHKTDLYRLSNADVSLISTASTLHDIGKIAISEEILNKPGKLTEEEFNIIKTHTVIGARMLKEMPIYQNEPLIKTAYEVCRWHHERYDGRGYPDGLKGDDIPISSQVVALADVYDALTSKRIYKEAFSHETSIQMILDGECGAFNPLLLECLTDLSDHIKEELNDNVNMKSDYQYVNNITQEILRREGIYASDRTLQLLEHERTKYSFFAAMSEEIQFEYSLSPSVLNLSTWGADKLGLPETIVDPLHDDKVLALLDTDSMRELSAALRSTDPENPVVRYDCKIKLNGDIRWIHIICRAIWSDDESPRYMGVIGKAVDIHEERLKMDKLKWMALHDGLTGLFNYSYAKKTIRERVESLPNNKFAMAIIDVDCFKSANEKYGRIFGDRVLSYVAERLRRNIRSGDIAARIGGDEFLIFLEYRENVDAAIDRIFSSFIGEYEGFPVSASMGIARTEFVGNDYDTLLHAADAALYIAKQSGCRQYRYYSDFMQTGHSAISNIDSPVESFDNATEGSAEKV